MEERFVEAVRGLETPRDREVAFQVDIDKKMMVQGFAALRVQEFMRICSEHGKRFTVLCPRTADQPSVEIKVDDRREHQVKPPLITDEKALIQVLETTYAWNFVGRLTSGSVVVLQMKPTTATHSEQLEDLLESSSILNIEITPTVWNLSYIVPRAWPTSLKQLRHRYPERFKGHPTTVRRSQGSIYRRRPPIKK